MWKRAFPSPRWTNVRPQHIGGANAHSLKVGSSPVPASTQSAWLITEPDSCKQGSSAIRSKEGEGEMETWRESIRKYSVAKSLDMRNLPRERAQGYGKATGDHSPIVAGSR